jgi:hypothetical protein
MKPEELINWWEGENSLTIADLTYEGIAGLGFRDESLPFFDAENSFEFVSFKDLDNMSLDYLKANLFQGLRISMITRITGYFTVTSGWNKGKLAELKDRDKDSVIDFGLASKPAGNLETEDLKVKNTSTLEAAPK